MVAKKTNMKKIIWVDDDIKGFSIRAYLDELIDNNIEVIEIDDPDKFLIDYENIEHEGLIMDVMMPTGTKLSHKETNAGLETGLKLIEIYREKFKTKKIIIFSILNADNVKSVSRKYNATYISKTDMTPLEFYEYIQNENTI